MAARKSSKAPKPLPKAPAAGTGCCGGGAPVREALAEGEDVRGAVRAKYGAVAEGRTGAAGCCAGPADAAAVLAQVGYGPEDAAAIPEGANLGLGCGNPTALADLKAGETVLDLGSGGGIDCFLAARRVGRKGRVIGVDMTPAMVERARRTARESGFRNVEFRLGEIENLPVADGTVDAVISNCVVNLSPDKPRVYREAFRALRPGGRLLVSDLVLLRPLDARLRRDVDLYVGCVAGAALKGEYLRMIREAGFADVEVVAEGTYAVGESALAEGSPEREAFAAVSSVKVRAVKPR